MFNFFFKETRIIGEKGRERCCRVRTEEERRTKKEENKLLDFRCSKRKIRQIDFGVAKENKRCGQIGVGYVRC